MSLLLGVNIDHVATLRQARYAGMLESPNAEPSILQAAELAKAGGADSLTVHVREDRRHMQAEDVFLLKKENLLPLNLEMANTDAMVALALDLQPQFVCLVPESREEVTTEGGLDVASDQGRVADAVARLRDAGIWVSLFLDPDRLIRLGHPPMRLEILTSVTGLEFADSYRSALHTVIEGVPVVVISLADLRKNKRAAGRAKDLADLEELPET
jgi:pyridoxine 5'-phosphate synthase